VVEPVELVSDRPQELGESAESPVGPGRGAAASQHGGIAAASPAHRGVEQRGSAHTGLAAKDQGSTPRGRLVEKPVDNIQLARAPDEVGFFRRLW
jgi:hypothetical protein